MRDLRERLARNTDAPGMHRAIQNKADQVAAQLAATRRVADDPTDARRFLAAGDYGSARTPPQTRGISRNLP